MREIQIRITVPERVWGRLATVADARGCRIGELLTSMLADDVRVITTDGRARRSHVEMDAAMQARLAELNRLGRSWREIAPVLGVSYDTVRWWAARLGLKSPRQVAEERKAAQRATERNEAA